jgi:hypothetical protein
MDHWRARRRAFLSVVLALFAAAAGVGHVGAVALDDPAVGPGRGVHAQLAWLSRSLDADAAAVSGAYFPEGELFYWEFTGLAWLDAAEADPALRGEADRVARRALAEIDRVLDNPPFRRMKSWHLRGGVCWFAGQNLLRARLVEVLGADDQRARLHADSAILAHAFATSRTGVLEAHPGMSWPVDSLFGYRSLLIHDRLFGTRYFRTYDKWKASMLAALDPQTGLMPSFLHLDGRPRDVPRGCALSWSLAVLPHLDPEFARSQWAAYREHFIRCAGGLCLVREYPVGVDRAADVDSGPVVGGFGMSATAFALAAARAQGDLEVAESLRRVGELVGVPMTSWWGKRYLGGLVPMFDVFSAWTRAIPIPQGAPPASAAPGWVLGVALALAWAGLVSVLVRRAWRRVRALRGEPARLESGGQHRPPGARRSSAASALAAAALVATHLVWPAFSAWALLAALLVTCGLLDATHRFVSSEVT